MAFLRKVQSSDRFAHNLPAKRLKRVDDSLKPFGVR